MGEEADHEWIFIYYSRFFHQSPVEWVGCPNKHAHFIG